MAEKSEHENAIAGLHAWWCKRTGAETKLFFSQRLWHDRLRDYQYDAEKLRADVELILRYLKREIARDKVVFVLWRPRASRIS